MPVNHDDSDERNARIDMLIEQVRTKAEAAHTTAQAAKDQSRETQRQANANVTSARGPRSRKKAG